jgi:hypothetical protein
VIKNTLLEVPIQVPPAGPVDTSEKFSQANPSVTPVAPANLLAQLEQQAGQQNQSAEKMADQVKAERCTSGRTWRWPGNNEWTFFAPLGLIQSTSLLGRERTGFSLMELFLILAFTLWLPFAVAPGPSWLYPAFAFVPV